METNEQIQLKVWVPMKLHQDFKVSCTLNKTSMTQVIGDLLTEYLSREKKRVS